MKIDPILSAIIDTADAANAAPDDYINLEDGLKYCGKCHTPKEAYFADNPPFCGIDRHPTECKCAAEEKQQREAERHEFERMSHISLLRSEAFRDISALLILDDLGAERNTSYGKECVFDVVNRRLLSGKPMIITTDITLSAMQKATDLDDRRIYDRILEVCVPILFNGENFRKGNAAENLKKAAELLKLPLS